MSKKIERASMTQTDAKGNVTRAPRDNSKGEIYNFKWWKLEENEMANAIAQTINFISRHQTGRLEQLTVSTRLYGSSTAYNLLGSAMTRSSSVNSNPSSQRISFNLCSSVVDTLTSKIAKNKVVPTYITNGAVWDYQKQAKQLTKFAQGLCYEQKVNDKKVAAFRDSAVWGQGIVHVFEKNDKVCIERVLPHEIFVDQVEAMATDPTAKHRVKFMDRDVAIELFPDFEEELTLVNPASYLEIGGQGTSADLIVLTESWHLRSGPDAEDGMKVICCGDKVLDKEKWDKDYFPFPTTYYSKNLLGADGKGACERLQNLQGEINRLMMLDQKSRWMMGSFKVLLENGSKVVTQHLNNDVGTIIHYTGTPPQYITPPAIDPSNEAKLDSLIAKGYQQEGVSQLSASAIKPLGVNSGKAMRTMSNIEDDRFLTIEQEMENFVLEIVRQSIEVVKDIHKRKGSYEVVFPTTNFIESVDWSDIDLDESQYVLKAYPTSSLADDLSGRLADIQELAQAGMISPRTAKRLMDMPDIEMNDNLTNAAEDLLHKVIEDILYDGEITPPQTDWDFQLCLQLIQEYSNFAQLRNCPDEKIQKLRDFKVLVQDLVDQAQAAAAQQAATLQAASQPPQPMANPMPTPQSNLVPNVNMAGVQ